MQNCEILTLNYMKLILRNDRGEKNYVINLHYYFMLICLEI